VGVRLVDFGFAKFVRERRFTADGFIAGSPSYIAPEIWLDSKHIDHRIDVYSLAAVIFRALAGTPPFASKDLVEVAEACHARGTAELASPPAGAQASRRRLGRARAGHRSERAFPARARDVDRAVLGAPGLDPDTRVAWRSGGHFAKVGALSCQAYFSRGGARWC
jgi:serine/threonine protein kinase